MKNSKKSGLRDFFPVLALGGLFVVIDSLALLLTEPFESAGLVAFPDPNDPLDIVYLFSVLIIFTVVILLIAKYWKKRVIQGIVLGSVGLLIVYTAWPLLAHLIADAYALILSLAVSASLVVALVKYPEWYVIDLCCIFVGAGAISMLGISLSISLVIIFLIGLAIYDAISVYKTKHMIDLADAFLDLRLPVILAIPKTLKYSLIREEKRLKERLVEGGKREAFFMGLGDIVMPGLLVVSTFYNIPNNGLIVSISVMLGTLLGFAVLMAFAVKGNPQAGLPFLCSGAIFGYIISSLILFGALAGLHFPI